MIKRKCKQCGKEFTLTNSEINFYKEKNLELPKRCNECRKQNKNKNKSNDIDKISIKDDESKESNSSNINSKNQGVKKTIRNTIIIGLLILLTFIGKAFNIDLSGLDISKWTESQQSDITLQFRNDQLWEDHFLKHESEFAYKSKEEYLNGANSVIASPESLHKKEAEDGDDIYYDEAKNEIVFVSEDGYIRTYFKPSEGIEYFNKQ